MGDGVESGIKSSAIKDCGWQGGEFTFEHGYPSIVKAKNVWALVTGEAGLEALAVVLMALLLVVDGDVRVLGLIIGDDRSNSRIFLPQTPVGKGDWLWFLGASKAGQNDPGH